MMARAILPVSIAVAFALAIGAFAQQDGLPSSCAASPEPFAGLIRWVTAEGTPETFPAKILGLAEDGEIAVFQKAYRNPATHLVHAVDISVADGHCDVVFIVDDVGNVTTWVTDAGAAIVRTYHLARGENERVPNDRYVSEFETIKSYFLERVPDRYAP